jgi:hypothetical protein
MNQMATIQLSHLFFPLSRSTADEVISCFQKCEKLGGNYFWNFEMTITFLQTFKLKLIKLLCQILKGKLWPRHNISRIYIFSGNRNDNRRATIIYNSLLKWPELALPFHLSTKKNHGSYWVRSKQPSLGESPNSPFH